MSNAPDVVFQQWTSLASHLIGDCFDAASPFIASTFEGLDPQVRFVNAQLFIDCHLSSESVLILIRSGKEWDADILFRPVLEGTFKYAYMMSGPTEEVARKAKEYWDILPTFVQARRAERLSKFLSDVDDPDDPAWNPFHEIVEGQKGFQDAEPLPNKKLRQKLELEWSFFGISQWMLRQANEGLKKLPHMAHGYGMSSHLVHKDGDGVGMVWERCRRAEERQLAAKLGHSARIVSDVCCFAQMRLAMLLAACRQDKCVIKEIDQKYGSLQESLKDAQRLFSQVEYGIEGHSSSPEGG